MPSFRLTNRGPYAWFFGVGLLAIIIIYMLAPFGLSNESLVPTLTAFGAFIAFLYAQHLQETLLFRDLFTNFNRRYDKLNERLNAIEDSRELRSDEINVLIDYFNLCAEEYIFSNAGYIDKTVWDSWRRGMIVFSKKTNIQTLWVKELQSGSYYGFTLEQLNS